MPITSVQSNVGSGTTRTAAVATFETGRLARLFTAHAWFTYCPSPTPVPTTRIMRNVLRSFGAKVRLDQSRLRPLDTGSSGTPFRFALPAR